MEIYIFDQIWVGCYNIIGIGDSRERAIDESWNAYCRSLSFGKDADFKNKEKWLNYYGINRELRIIDRYREEIKE